MMNNRPSLFSIGILFFWAIFDIIVYSMSNAPVLLWFSGLCTGSGLVALLFYFRLSKERGENDCPSFN